MGTLQRLARYEGLILAATTSRIQMLACYGVHCTLRIILEITAFLFLVDTLLMPMAVPPIGLCEDAARNSKTQGVRRSARELPRISTPMRHAVNVHATTEYSVRVVG